MKKFLIALLVTLSSMAIVVSEAEARRLGGGGSFGRQSQGISRQAPAAKPAAAPAATAPAAVPPKPASPWRGIIGGAMLGLGLGALMSHFGLGGALAEMLGTLLMVGLLAMAAMFIYRMFRRKNGEHDSRPAYVGGYPSANTPEIGSRLEPYAQPAALQSVPLAGGDQALSIPSDFDVPGFLRNAKTYFIRLQAAWDKADINDIREFTSTEMFAELKLQIQERGASPNHTDVISLDAELLGVDMTGNDYLASVRFSGMIKEADNAPAEPFSEVWNLSKPKSGAGGWLLAGVQQLS